MKAAWHFRKHRITGGGIGGIFVAPFFELFLLAPAFVPLEELFVAIVSLLLLGEHGGRCREVHGAE